MVTNIEYYTYNNVDIYISFTGKIDDKVFLGSADEVNIEKREISIMSASDGLLDKYYNSRLSIYKLVNQICNILKTKNKFSIFIYKNNKLLVKGNNCYFTGANLYTIFVSNE